MCPTLLKAESTSNALFCLTRINKIGFSNYLRAYSKEGTVNLISRATGQNIESLKKNVLLLGLQDCLEAAGPFQGNAQFCLSIVFTVPKGAGDLVNGREGGLSAMLGI